MGTDLLGIANIGAEPVDRWLNDQPQLSLAQVLFGISLRNRMGIEQERLLGFDFGTNSSDKVAGHIFHHHRL